MNCQFYLQHLFLSHIDLKEFDIGHIVNCIIKEKFQLTTKMHECVNINIGIYHGNIDRIVILKL